MFLSSGRNCFLKAKKSGFLQKYFWNIGQAQSTAIILAKCFQNRLAKHKMLLFKRTFLRITSDNSTFQNKQIQEALVKQAIKKRKKDNSTTEAIGK